MSTNPYEPPGAEVADIPSETTAVPPYFAVSLPKMAVMSLCTFGFYEVYWFYRNWKLVKEREGTNIVPVMRAILSLFYCYALFSRVRDTGAQCGVSPLPAAGLLAVAWIVFAFGWMVFSFSWALSDFYALVSFASHLVPLPVQACANRINTDAVPNHCPNSHFSAWNWAGVAVGVVLIALTIAGIMLPDEYGADQ